MSELETGVNLREQESGGLDIDAIFGGGGEETDPFAAAEDAALFKTLAEEPAEELPQLEPPSAEQPRAEKKTEPKTPETPEPDLFAVFGQQAEKPTPEQKTAAPQQVSLFDKPPVFSYGSTKESIADASMTFEELRIAKSEDFPELAEGKKVSWIVEYGRSSKAIADPKGTTIASVKEEIEKSKAFLDQLKKAKETEKNPDCIVKPRVTAQSKGIAAYKGVFPSVEEAQASDKTICLIPARNGRFFELRKTEMGDFIAPKDNIVEFSVVRAGFTPALPLIPRELVDQIISFFRCFMNKGGEFEAMAHIYWDRENEEFIAHVPRQEVSKTGIHADLSGDTLPEERYLLYADIHSHNSMEARFSVTDDRDELATRLYFVVGRLHRYYPTITARVSCGGVYREIDPSTVIESVGAVFPHGWLDKVKPSEHGRYGHDGLREPGNLPGGLPGELAA